MCDLLENFQFEVIPVASVKIDRHVLHSNNPDEYFELYNYAKITASDLGNINIDTLDASITKEGYWYIMNMVFNIETFKFTLFGELSTTRYMQQIIEDEMYKLCDFKDYGFRVGMRNLFRIKEDDETLNIRIYDDTHVNYERLRFTGIMISIISRTVILTEDSSMPKYKDGVINLTVKRYKECNINNSISSLTVVTIGTSKRFLNTKRAS